MFKLPLDIENELMKKYPHVDIINLFHDLTTLVIQKACFDGSCPIREFGKFIAFKIYSHRLKKDTVRFKFKHSISFLNRIKNDKYMTEKLAVKETVPFTEYHQQKCADKQNRKTKLNALLPKIHESTKAKTDYKVATQEIFKILESDNSND